MITLVPSAIRSVTPASHGRTGQGSSISSAIRDEDVPGHDDVIGHPEGVEAQRVGPLRHPEEVARLEGAAEVGKAEPDLHGVSSGRCPVNVTGRHARRRPSIAAS